MKAHLCALLFLLVACSDHHMASEGKSNWLRQCDEDAACGSDLACVCGVCTVACDSAAACDQGDVASTCVDPSADGLGSQCAAEAHPAAPAICLRSCLKDSECPDRADCVQGVCASAVLTGEN